MACKDKNPISVANEAADILFHMQVSLAYQNVSWEDVLKVLAKRRGELIIYTETNKVIRRGIEKYSLNNINRAILILGFSIIILYVDYITSSNFFSTAPNKQSTYWTLELDQGVFF